MNELDDIDGLAAEYVLGTLNREERLSVESRLLSEPALKAGIEAWQRRLTPLADTVTPVLPPPNLYNKIRAQIGLSAHVISLKARERQLTQRGNRWRNAAAAMTAMAASLVGVVAIREQHYQQMPTQFVAVLQAGDDKPAFLMTVDTRTHNCVITAVAAPKKAEKSYEVWMVHDQLPKPKSLGVMSEGDMNVMPMADGPDNDMFMNASFAVSLEPEGGSPTGAPTGPVLFSGKLMKATP
ncbi:MAG: anti-sigma factor [Hyphomicrobium sp.]